jgi:polyribonucleotide nucleotidyltransferase
MATYPQLENAVFSMMVVGKRSADGGIDIAMVEAGATENALRLVAGGQAPVNEATVALGLEEAKAHIARLIDLQVELRAAVGEIPVVDFPITLDYSEELLAKVIEAAAPRLAEVVRIAPKQERQAAEDAAREATLAGLGIGADHEDFAAAGRAFKTATKKAMRRRVVEEGIRLDGRRVDEVRPISVEVGVVARAHGSGLFQRGETQVLNVTTLGMLRMEQMLDTISVEDSKRYMHHYNFPPFCTGEVGFMRGPKRREIGHGALAEKAVLPVIPTTEQFPYAFRLVSEVLSSNGSSSMASVCGSSLSLMDAGVPIAAAVGGVAMGLIAHEGGFITLTDIIGAEDSLGDMDFKVAGTDQGITALQMDIKITGVTFDIMRDALARAKKARLFLLDRIHDAIAAPRAELSDFAPRIATIRIDPEKIGAVIGKGGETIRGMEAEFECTIDVAEDGLIKVFASDGKLGDGCIERIGLLTRETRVGDIVEGRVASTTSFGAFVTLKPGTDGLVHISRLADHRVNVVEDVVNRGDLVRVEVLEVQMQGGKEKISLRLLENLSAKEG